MISFMPESDPMRDAQTAYLSPEETPTVVPGAGAEAQVLQLAPGTVLGGRYRIVSLIGRGGMGVVYRADDLRLGQTIAVKFLSRRGGDEQRLYEEVRIGREVSHPNVVRLHDIAEIDGHLFITMEFVGGEDLAALLRRIGRPSSEKALAMARDICEGLAAAHERGVIHRDLKPGNVLIDGRGRVRITDFGLAVGEQAGTPHAEAGTPAYMAPEQLTGGSASLQSDVYALGLILYEVFTGRRTFDVSSAVELVRRQIAADFLRPTALVRDIDPIIERIIVRCLDPRPERRPQSVAEILSELPGRDALSAAVAAGETPSPAMVAAAAERGDLPVIAAASLLAVIVALLALFAGLTSRTMLYRLLPVLKSPEVLEEKAREIIASTGQSAPRADSDFHFYVDRDERAYRQSHHIDRPSATSMLFLYRQSPRPMVSQNLERRVVTDDPPLNVSGMADVTLDASGRLVELIIVPGQVKGPLSFLSSRASGTASRRRIPPVCGISFCKPRTTCSARGDYLQRPGFSRPEVMMRTCALTLLAVVSTLSAQQPRSTMTLRAARMLDGKGAVRQNVDVHIVGSKIGADVQKEALRSPHG
jgi:serine/threonine-protein kinase